MLNIKNPGHFFEAFTTLFAWTILLASPTGSFASAEEPQYTFEADILPLVEIYCLDCHNAEDLKGDLDLERFTTMESVNSAFALWERIGKRIESGEMPPGKRPDPTDDEKEILLGYIRSLEFDNEACDQVASEETVSWYPGFVMSRRLNRHEYENTVRDLLGIDLDLVGMFPADGGGGEGFSTDGGALFMSAIHVEKYLDAADLAVETALPSRLAPRDTRALIPSWPDGRTEAREAARECIAWFTKRAWRRPVSDAETERILQMFDGVYARGDGYLAAIKYAYKAALVSPHFLFLAEPEPASSGVYALGDYPLATRLSYFLWASMPDAELFSLADAGILGHDTVLRDQVQRMLADPKARALGEVFAMQWLGIDQLGETTRPDADRFPEYDAMLEGAMRAEAAGYFTRIVREDRSILELLDSDYVLANERLANHYGIDGVFGDELQVVPADDPSRGGVLGMAAVLTSTSHALRTSPVLRGKWVLERLLGDRIPPPPPDAGALPEDDVQPDGLSLRERLIAHRRNPECAACHERMDPIGFGLENFDPIGRWRDENAGLPIDSAGVLPSGEGFEGPVELKNILLKQKDKFARHLSRKALGYALGRALTRYDQCVIDDCVEELKLNDYRASTVFETIVMSSAFRNRYSGGKNDGGDS